MATPVRKSKRTITPKKYTIDPFAGKEALLLASSDSGSDTSESGSEEDEFDAQQAEIIEAEEAAADEHEVIPIEDSPVSSDDEQLELDHNLGGDIIEGPTDVDLDTTRHAKPSQKEKLPEESEIHRLPAFDLHGAKTLTTNIAPRGRFTRRGIPDNTHNLDKENRVIFAVGTGTEDLIAHIQCRDKWINEATFPSRNARRDNSGGLAYSYFHTEERRKNEVEQGWKWYYEQGGYNSFQQGQKIGFPDSKDSQRRLLSTLSPSEPFLLGPSREPTLIESLQPFASTNTSKAWSNGSKPHKKNAWIFNAGARIQCMEWVPNQKGNAQYLSVVTSGNNEAKSNETEFFNVYTPSKNFQAYLQIWEFAAQESSTDQSRRIDFSKEPTLRFVIAFGWGSLRRLKWCPVPARDSKDQNPVSLRLGLLAGIWTDGKVRVLDLLLPLSNDTRPKHVYISNAAFESRPPDTVCTGLTWLSSSSIAASCANGFVAIWNIPSHFKQKPASPSQSPSDAQPWFYQSFHLNYILSITSAYPSRPHFLITKGIDGFNKLTDLRNPNLDVVLSPRDRITQPPLLWHDVTQTALSTDDNFDVKLHAVRLFYKSQAIARMNALVTTLASSVVHPFVLVGCADGSVWSTNPMKRMRQQKKGNAQQVWFKHEWRRPIVVSERPSTPEDTTMHDAIVTEAEPNLSASSPENLNILAKPLIRFTEAYKLTRPDLTNGKRTNQTKEDVAFTTIYEEKTAVTQVSWNPNLHCGTWAAAGMASGLIRVEDLSLD